MSAEDQIVTLLERNMYAGRKPWTVFEDWLDVVLATTTMMPAHMEAAIKTGKPAEDPPDVAVLWSRLNKTYGRDDWDNFREAYRLLVETVHDRMTNQDKSDNNSWDILGSVYMALNVSSNHAGQYFTPWSAAHIMAAMLTPNMGEKVAQRLRAAVECVKDSAERALLDSSVLLACAADDENMFHNVILPTLATYVEPITVHDPCCGSGIMLLAVAARVPNWARHWGIVRFYGQDIDATCVKMAQVNMMLYGLNGFGLRVQLAMQGVGKELQRKHYEQEGIRLEPQSNQRPVIIPVPVPVAEAITPATEHLPGGQLTLF